MQPKDMKTIRRGEIYSYDFGITEGSIQSGRRPVLVIQADNFNEKAPTVIVASITTVIKKRYLPSHIILGDRFGLLKPSMVLLEQIQTVNKSDLKDYIDLLTMREAGNKSMRLSRKPLDFGFIIYKELAMSAAFAVNA